MFTLKKFIIVFLSLVFIVSFSNCKTNNDEPKNPKIDKCKESILIYMIGTNNLNSYMEKDIQEIYVAAQYLDLEENKILIYEHGLDNEPVLYQLIRENGEIGKKIISSYIENVSSASKERLSLVINDMKSAAPAENYGLILWSHALGWLEGNSPQKLKFDDTVISPTWYGEDFGTNMNIDDLAIAIPDNMFHFIWMDCCYMSSIEFIYQIRNKCNWFIGYPTEILADGMPYDQTIPLIMKDGIDIIGAAAATFDYYNENPNTKYKACTIAVVDMSQIENVALKASQIISISQQVNTSIIQTYSRNIAVPFYDLGDYLNNIIIENGLDNSLSQDIKNALNKAVVYKRATSKFITIPIDINKYCGISTHILKNDGSAQEEYYKTLDWYRKVYVKSN